jgi:hypothetical protein
MTTKHTRHTAHTHHTTERKTKPTEHVAEGVNSFIGLSQKTASVMLKSTVQTVNVAENYVQGLYKVGYDTQIAGMEVAKAYWDSMSQIRQDWLRLFSETGEKAITATSDIELPFQKEVMDLGKNVFASVEKMAKNFTTPFRHAAK